MNAIQRAPIPERRALSRTMMRPAPSVSTCRGQSDLPERPVDDDGNAALRRQRQQARLRLAIDDVVGELYEIDRLVPHDLFEKIVTAAFGCSDSNVTHRARRLHLEEHLQMRLP